jgi:hypothetical protein
VVDKLILFTYEAWAAVDAATAGLDDADAEARHDGASPIAWTVGHVTHMVDSWINVNFQGMPPHPLINTDVFRTGASGDSPPWPEVMEGVADVRRRARAFLDRVAGPDLERRVPYAGSILLLRETGLSLSYALMRISAHHFMHAGEIETIRARVGHSVRPQPDWARGLM